MEVEELLKSIDEEIGLGRLWRTSCRLSLALTGALSLFNETEDVFLTNFERKGQAVHGFSFQIMMDV